MRPGPQMQQELRLSGSFSEKCITFCMKWHKRGRSDRNTSKNVLFLQRRENMEPSFSSKYCTQNIQIARLIVIWEFYGIKVIIR